VFDSMTMGPHRTVQDCCASEFARSNNFPVIEMLSMVCTLQLSHTRAVRKLPLLPARLALVQDGAPPPTV
jgi:hypothetical protein